MIIALDALRSYLRVYSHTQYIRNTLEGGMVPSHCTVSYADGMTSRGTPGRMVRIEEDLWADYGQLCKEKGIARAADIRMYVVREVTAWRKQQARQAALERRLKHLGDDSSNDDIL